MNKSRKYLVLVVLTLIPYVTSTEKKDPKKDSTESNYLTEQIRKDYGDSLPLFLKSRSIGKNVDAIRDLVPLAIEDKEEAGHVKVIARGITSDVLSVKNEDTFSTTLGHFDKRGVMYDELTMKTNNETVRVIYDYYKRFLLSSFTFVQQAKAEKQEQEGQAEAFCCKSNQQYRIGKTLQNAIKLNQSKTDYDEEQQTLTITIPRVKNKQAK